jgi:hypothetical protein
MKRSLPRALSGITASKAETFPGFVSAAGALPVILEMKLLEAAGGAACTSVEDMVWLPSSRNAGECHLRADVLIGFPRAQALLWWKCLDCRD